MQDYKYFPDNQLIELLKESDHAAYTEIYNRYNYQMYVHAYKKLRNEIEAKDIIQELFTSLWIKRHSIHITNNLAGYLYTSVRNKIFNLFAHQKVKLNYIQSLNNYVTNNSNTTDYIIREKEFSAYIAREISALPPKMRVIFEMNRKEYLSYKEIAETLEISENNVSKQVNNALRILKMRLGIIVYIYLLTRF
jgi:RNA polymerase sigma-70 factor (family 1)